MLGLISQAKRFNRIRAQFLQPLAHPFMIHNGIGKNFPIPLNLTRILRMGGKKLLNRPLVTPTCFAHKRSSLPDRKRRSEEHTSELQSRGHLVCRLLLEKKNKKSGIVNITKSVNRREKSRITTLLHALITIFNI